MYVVLEKIKLGAERVAIAKLKQKDLMGAELSGGYIIRVDHGPPDFRAGGQGLEYVYPQARVMRDPVRAPQREYLSNYIDGFRRAIDTDDFRDPDTGLRYDQYIDVDAWIDHNILNAIAKNVDAFRFSAYYHKQKEGLLAAGPIWDFDRSLGTPYDARARDAREWKQADTDGTDYFKWGWWGRLFEIPEFRLRYRSRFWEVLDGPLSVARLHAMIDEMALEIGPAAARNFERWSSHPPRNDSHAAEVLLLKEFLSDRIEFIRGELTLMPY